MHYFQISELRSKIDELKKENSKLNISVSKTYLHSAHGIAVIEIFTIESTITLLSWAYVIAH